MIIKYYINNIQVNPPENQNELTVELNYDRDIPKLQVSTNKWRFVRENAKIIEDHFTGGITGGVGVFEGMPFRIDLEHFGQLLNLLNGYIDGSEKTEISCDDITVGVKEKQKIDWLNDVSDSISFEKLFADGKITTDDFVFVPYCINSIPNTMEAIVALITSIYIGKELVEKVQELISDIVHCVNPFEATFIITTVIRIVYIIFLLIVLIELINSFVQYVIQPVKYHAGMRVADLFRIGCQHFGLTFQSSIINNNIFSRMVLVDTKYELSSNTISNNAMTHILSNLIGQVANIFNQLKGFRSINLTKQRGYSKTTFGQFVRDFKFLFNAKVILRNGNLIFERRDYNTSAVLYQIPAIRNDFYSLNVDEFKSNFLLNFQTDINDKNTIDQYKGTSYQAIISPQMVVNADLKLMRNLERRDFPFALAKRKEKLTFAEVMVKFMVQIINVATNLYIQRINIFIQTVNVAIQAINTIIAAFNTINDIIDAVNSLGVFNIPSVNFSFINVITPVPLFTLNTIVNPIDDRKGIMILENDFIDVPKLMLIDENKNNPRKTKISDDNSTVITGKYFWENFHFIDSFAEAAGLHNQFYEYELEKVPFCFDDFQKVREDNKCYAPDGTITAEILTLQWNVKMGHAKIKYRVNKKYTNNLILTTIEPDGN